MFSRGFTLVELSIVLVIIGLLIGGILAAQSMIQTSIINKTVRNLQQYDVAYANFYTKFNKVPGDTTIFSCTIPGDNNTQISSSEAMCFWSHLSIGTNLKNVNGGDYSEFPSLGTFTPNNCPELPIETNYTHGCLVASYNAISIGNFNAFVYTYVGGWDRDFVTARDLLAIDTKIDDAIATTGNVIGKTMGSFPGDTLGVCENSGTYDVGDTRFNCTAAFKIGISNAGEL